MQQLEVGILVSKVPAVSFLLQHLHLELVALLSQNLGHWGVDIAKFGDHSIQLHLVLPDRVHLDIVLDVEQQDVVFECPYVHYEA